MGMTTEGIQDLDLDLQHEENSLSLSLENAFNVQSDVLDLENKIKALKKKSGLSALEKELKAKKEELQSLCEQFISQGIRESGSYRILDEGRSNRIVDPDLLKEYSTQIYLSTMEFPVTKVEKAIYNFLLSEGLDEDAAKEKAKEDATSLSTIVRNSKYAIINMELEE